MTDQIATANEVPPSTEDKPKKSVGFAPLPVEDLKEHHKVIKQKEEEAAKSNPFQRIPPELAYLEKKAPTPKLVGEKVAPKIKPYDYTGPLLGNLKNKPIKDVSFINKATEVNFNYPTISLPISDNHLLVDVKYASLNSNDLSKINKYVLNLSGLYVGLGYEFAGIIMDVGSKLKSRFKRGDYVCGITDPNDKKGSLSTELIISPSRDVVVVITQEDLDIMENIDISLNFGKADFSEFDVESNSSSLLNHEDPMLNIGIDLRDVDDMSKVSADDTLAEASSPAPAKDITLEDISLEDNPYVDTAKVSDDKEQEGNQSETNTQPETESHTETKPDTHIAKTPTIPKDFAQPFELGELTAFAKFSAFPSLYCRAKEVLTHLTPGLSTANILINGADANLGFTLIQLLNSDLYSFTKLNLILTIREKSYKYMENFVQLFTKGKYYDPSKITKISLITHDIFPSYKEDLILPGERILVKFKKDDLFTAQIIEAMFKTQYYDDDELINKENFAKYRLDLFVDIVGCKKFFQKAVNWKNLDGLQLAIHSHTSTTLSNLFTGSINEPFLVKLLKPKKQGSALVSCCRFTMSKPTYEIDKLVNFYPETVTVNPWASKWSTNIFNNFTTYNYFEALELRIKTEWVAEGFAMLKQDKLKFRIDEFSDWRVNFKKSISRMRVEDGKVIFKIEDF